MNTFCRKLNHFISKSIAPEALITADLSAADFSRWEWFLKDQACELRMLMTEHLLSTQTSESKIAWMRSLQEHLVRYSDLVNSYLLRQRIKWQSHAQAKMIRCGYLHTLKCLEGLLAYGFRHHYHWYQLDVKIADHHLRHCLPDLRFMAQQMRLKLLDAEVDPALAEIVLKGIYDRLKSRNFSGIDQQYCIRLMTEIMGQKRLQTAVLTDLLIRLNFNRPQFLLYLMNSWHEAILHSEGLHEQLQQYVLRDGHLRSLQAEIEGAFHPAAHTLLPDLLRFCREQKDYLRELIELRKLAREEEFDVQKAFRILSHLTVPQISLFVRMLVEKGVFATKTLSDFYRFIAMHFYTERANFISVHSLIRNSTEVDFATAFKLFQVLNSMIDWLDEKFSVRNFKQT